MFAFLSTVVTLGACVAYVMANSSGNKKSAKDRELEQYEYDKKYNKMKQEKRIAKESMEHIKSSELGMGE